MMSSGKRWWMVVGWACLASTAALAADKPPLPEFKPPDAPQVTQPLGQHLQRTMTLLATSTPTHRNRVRILYYGQSITAQAWTGEVTAYLKAQYPNADIQAENRAIGGFTAPSLIRTAEFDLYNYYPDLLIFHVYDGHRTGELEKIIQRVRQRTAADILIRTPHLRWAVDVPRDGTADDPKIKGADSSDEAQAAVIRELAVKYNLELADTRTEWRRWLAKYDVKPKDLLADGIHLNPTGVKLMAALVTPHLRYDPALAVDRGEKRVHDLAVGSPNVTRAADGSYEVKFTGNRLDVIAAAAPGGALGTAKILIDGRAPADFQELYTTSRPTVSYKMWWPAVSQPGHTQPRVFEHWSLKITKVDTAANNFWYTVTGSQTGPDGEGQKRQKFVSNSGRVVIETGDWWMETIQKYAGNAVVPEGFEVTWDVKPLYQDPYRAVAAADPAHETATTLVLGLSNGSHTLRLVPNGDGAVPVAGFRAYTPPLGS